MIAVLLAPYLSPVATSIEWKTQYTYANEYRQLALATSVKLESPKNSFVVELETESQIDREDAVTFAIFSNGTEKHADLELSGDETERGAYFTAPIHFEPTDEIRVECSGCETLTHPVLHLVSLDTRSSVGKIAYDPDAFAKTAHAAPSAFPIVSRAEWGADENLRYADSEIWKNIFKKQSAAKPTEAAKKQLAKNIAIEASLEEKFPEQSRVSEIIWKENGHDLVWPIEKAASVRQMVVHHTAEDNVKSLSDEELIRSFYYYHTIVRGWGDIGYQFVVGQRGVVYEGRAGGDYAVGAHASWNNRGTVGVSVIGNYEKDKLVKEQKATLEKFLTALSKKYGIDTNTTLTGHKACKVDEECMTHDYEMKGLVGHRDVGFTSCPGANLYAEINDRLLPKLNASSKGYLVNANPTIRPETIKKAKPIVIVNPRTDPKTNPATPNVATNDGPNIRIKLSVPVLKKIELEAVEGNPVLGWDKKSGKVAFDKISVKKVGNKVETTMGGKKYRTETVSLGATVVRINNWIRIPAWDKEKKYNDNEFRGKIEIRVEDGKLIAINEIPLELYLRGLAEFSNGENAEKAKTILVAARSYAMFYTSPDYRKFPGKPYDGSDDPDVFQKYLGYGYEKRSDSTIQYAKETRGEIITYQGKPIKPWYFSQSSGRTLSALEYCNARVAKKELPATTTCQDIAYLQSVADPGGEGKAQA